MATVARQCLMCLLSMVKKVALQRGKPPLPGPEASLCQQGLSLMETLLTLPLLLPFALCPLCFSRFAQAHSNFSLSPYFSLLPSLPLPPSFTSSYYFHSSSCFLFWVGRNRGRNSGPPHSGDVPGSSSLVSESALVDLGVVGHCGPLVSEVPAER